MALHVRLGGRGARRLRPHRPAGGFQRRACRGRWTWMRRATAQSCTLAASTCSAAAPPTAWPAWCARAHRGLAVCMQEGRAARGPCATVLGTWGIHQIMLL